MKSMRIGTVPRSFWRILGFTLAWANLPPGIYALYRGSSGWGTWLVLAGLAGLMIGLSRPILQWAESRAVYRPLGSLLIFSLMIFVPVELWVAGGSRVLDLQGKLLAFVHALIYLGLAILTAVRYSKSVRAA